MLHFPKYNYNSILKCIVGCCMFTPMGAPMGYGKPKQVCNVVRKWVEDKWNVIVVRWAINQVPTLKPTHEWRHVHTIFKRAFTKNEINFYKWSTKKTYN